VFGVPFNPVDGDTPTEQVEIRFNPGRSFTGPYPIADPAYIESMPTYGFDNHYVALDQGSRQMWELIGTTVWAWSPDISSSRKVWPTLATDGLSDSPDAPPMGTWLRLRADADLSGLGPQARVIAEGLQPQRMILADTSNERFGLRGTPDGRWDRRDLRTIGQLSADDFEVVDQRGIMVAPDSIAALPAGG
jgi:hypothetical protein